MSEDRISLLPDCLLHHILSSLNTKQVVQTCVLSKRWKTVWTCIPTLTFCLCDDLINGSIEDFELKLTSFYHFVLRVLSKHCGTNIIKLRYLSSGMNDDDDDNNEKYFVEFLICYAACHMIQKLEINTYSDNDINFDWIPCLSKCQSLNVLQIRSFYSDEWGVLMLPSLRILEIESPFSQHDLKYRDKMFAGCPNLESLVLVNFYCEGCATICAPKLENFEYRCTSDWMTICEEIELCTPNLRCFKFDYVIATVKSALDFPYLEKVNIEGDLCSDYVIESRQQVEQFLRVFHNARSITLPFASTKALSSVSANLRFDNLKRLELIVSEYCKKINLPINELRCLLKFPTLKTLVIDLI